MTLRNPPAIPADTDPETWRIQMAAMAARTPDDRLAEWAALNRALEVMEWESMVRRHPEYSERQVFLAVMRARYGPKLAVEAWPDILTELP